MNHLRERSVGRQRRIDRVVDTHLSFASSAISFHGDWLNSV